MTNGQGSRKLREYIAPVLIGGVSVFIGIMGYLSFNSYRGSEDVVRIKESQLVEKVDKGEQTFYYVSIKQRNSEKTHFRINDDKKTGKSLEQMGEELDKDRQLASKTKKNNTKIKYDRMTGKPIEEPITEKKTEEKYTGNPNVEIDNSIRSYKHIAAESHNYKHIAGAK